VLNREIENGSSGLAFSGCDLFLRKGFLRTVRCRRGIERITRRLYLPAASAWVLIRATFVFASTSRILTERICPESVNVCAAVVTRSRGFAG
jgi:hypothetical protein